MKQLKYLLLTLITVMSISNAEAKPVKTNHLYMIGFSASFKDSVIYVTDIQDVQGAWIDSKTKFLKSRDQYSYQLRDHLVENMKQPERICMVLFTTKKKKAEKLYVKLMKQYKTGYDVQYLSEKQFKFVAVELSEEESKAEPTVKKKKKEKKQAPPSGKKGKRPAPPTNLKPNERP